MATTMTHRLYINEYNQFFVNQISNNKIEGLYCTDESTDKVLVISGEVEALQTLAGLMYTDDFAVIKKAFPSFKTQEEMEQEIKELYIRIKRTLCDELITITNKYEGTGLYLYEDEKYTMMRDFALNMVNKMK